MLVEHKGEAVAYDFGAAAPGMGLGGVYQPAEEAFQSILVDFKSAQQTFHIGAGSVAVPGALQGLMRAHQAHGRLPLSEVLAPAIRATREGTKITDMGQMAFDLLDGIVRWTPAMEQVFTDNGRRYRAGDRYANPALSRLFEALASGAIPPTFAKGPLLEALLAEVKAQGGGVTQEDLAAYEVGCRAPIRVELSDEAELLLNPPPSSGGMLIAYGLLLLQGHDLPPADSLDEHLLLRAVMAETLVARAEIIGEETPCLAHVDALLSPEQIKLGRARLAAQLARGTAPLLEEAELENQLGSTTHVSVVDAEGNACSVTISNGECSGLILEEWGLPLNNVLGEEDLNPGGFHKFPPGARLGSTMCPCLLRWRGKEAGRVTALGSGGSNRIRTVLLQVIRNLVSHGMNVEAAVAAGRVHYEDQFYGEGTESISATGEALRAAGCEVSIFPARHMFFGGVHMVERDAQGNFSGVGDPRRSGAHRIVGGEQA